MPNIFAWFHDVIVWLFTDHLDTMMQIIGGALLPVIGGGIFFLVRRGGSGIHGQAHRRREEKRRLRDECERRERAEQQLTLYVESLKRHPDISRIHMMNMPQPLNLLDIYVPLRIHPESTLASALDPVLREAEETSDPNALFEVAQKSLEHRVDSALEPDEAIRRFRQSVIVGNPGAGKTTLLHYLALKAAKSELPHLPSLPIYVQLNTFDPNTHKNLLELIMVQPCGSCDMPELRALLLEKMSKGEVLLLLDGLDETKIGRQDDGERTYGVMIEAIKQLAADFQQMPIVVTVRKANYQYRPKLQGFYELEVVEFRLEDCKSFARKWLDASGTSSKQEKIKDLNARLERSLRIQSIASNPLLMSLILIVYEGRLDLPERRVGLYQSCIEVLQAKWDASRDIQRRKIFPLIFQPQLLQQVAWEFHTQGKRYFPVDDLLRLIREFLSGVGLPTDIDQDVLKQIAQENGLLREQAQGWYGFSHLTFQEYFVTQYIISNNCINDLLRYIHNPWWEEVILLYVGSVPNASPILKIILGHDETLHLEDDRFHTLLLLAGRCLGEKPYVLDAKLRDEITERLFDLLRTTPYTQARENAATTLAIIGGPSVYGRLQRLLATEDDTLLAIRESVGRALGEYGERSLAGPLVGLLMQVNSRFIRIVIARALSALCVQQVSADLLVLLGNTREDPYVLQSVALTLGMLGEHACVHALVDIFAALSDKKGEVTLAQQGIAIALGTLGNHDVVPQLERWLVNEELDVYVRGCIAKALSMLGGQESIPVLLSVITNNDDNAYVRRRAATILANFECDADCIDTLLSVLQDNTVEARIRGCIAITLGKMNKSDASIVPVLLELLSAEGTDRYVRISIAIALGHVEKSVEIMRVLYEMRIKHDTDADVCRSIIATQALLAQRPPTVQSLAEGLVPQPVSSDAASTQWKTPKSSGTLVLNMSEVLDDLLKILAVSNLNHDIMLHASYALRTVSAHQHVDKREVAYKLAEILAQPQLERYRGQHIARLLSAQDEASIVPTLINLLKDSTIDSAIRQEIASVIAQVADDAESVAQLTDLLTHTDIDDDIYRALWVLNRQAKTRIQQ